MSRDYKDVFDRSKEISPAAWRVLEKDLYAINSPLTPEFLRGELVKRIEGGAQCAVMASLEEVRYYVKTLAPARKLTHNAYLGGRHRVEPVRPAHVLQGLKRIGFEAEATVKKRKRAKAKAGAEAADAPDEPDAAVPSDAVYIIPATGGPPCMTSVSEIHFAFIMWTYGCMQQADAHLETIRACMAGREPVEIPGGRDTPGDAAMGKVADYTFNPHVDDGTEGVWSPVYGYVPGTPSSRVSHASRASWP